MMTHTIAQTPNTVDNTPRHCHDCQNFPTCNQAQNLHADTIAVPGFVETEKYVDYFCPDCLPDDCPDETTFPLDYEETDSPCHCSVCGVPLEHNLTSDGVRYVREAVAEGLGCCREVWPSVWSDVLLPDPYFDRFDICEAHYLYARLHGEYQTIARLHQMEFTPGLSLTTSDVPETALSENGQAIYYRLISRKGGTR